MYVPSTMSNVLLLIDDRQKQLFDSKYVHTLRSNQTLSFEISHNTTIKSDTKYASTAIDIDSNGEYLLSGDSVGAVSIHQINETDVNSCNEVKPTCYEAKTGHKYSINSIKWFPKDTGIFVSGSSDKSIQVWDTNEMAVVEKFKFSGHVYDAQLSAKGGKTSHIIAAAISNHQVKLCDMKSGSDTHTLRGHSEAVNNVVWSNRNSYALISAGRDGKIVMWDIRRSNAAVHYFDQFNGNSEKAHCGSVTSLSQTEGGLFLLSSGQDEQVRCWDMTNGENTFTNFGTAAYADVKSVGAAVSHNSCYPGLLYLPNGSDISVYDVLTGQHIKDLSGHFGRINAVCFNKVIPQLYSCSSDCTILVWEPPGPEPSDEVDNGSAPAKTQYQDTWSDSDDE